MDYLWIFVALSFFFVLGFTYRRIFSLAKTWYDRCNEFFMSFWALFDLPCKMLGTLIICMGPLIYFAIYLEPCMVATNNALLLLPVSGILFCVFAMICYGLYCIFEEAYEKMLKDYYYQCLNCKKYYRDASTMRKQFDVYFCKKCLTKKGNHNAGT